MPGSLPPVPDLDVRGFLPAIQDQLTSAVEVVSKQPADAEANAHLAMVLQSYSQFEPAVTLYTRAILLDDRGVWWYLKGQSLAALGRSEEAVVALAEARERAPKDPWIAGTHVLMRRMTGDRTAVAGELDDLVEANRQLPELRYTRARLYALNAELEKAVAEFQQTLDLAGPFGAGYYGLGMAQRRLGDDEAADSLALSRQFKDVVAQGSDPHLALIDALNLSDIRLIQQAERALLAGELRQAATLLDSALERNPQSTAAHLSLVGIYSNLREFGKAESHFEAARALEPERAKLFYNLGLMRFLQQRYVESERAFREALERETNADTYVQLALVQTARKQPELAKLSLKRAIELDPANRFARLQFAKLLSKAGDLDGVVTVLEGHYEPVDGGSAEILLLLSRAYNELGQTGQAQRRATRGLDVAENLQQKSLVNQLRRQLYVANQ